jgi:hypothetical protein
MFGSQSHTSMELACSFTVILARVDSVFLHRVSAVSLRLGELGRRRGLPPPANGDKRGSDGYRRKNTEHQLELLLSHPFFIAHNQP